MTSPSPDSNNYELSVHFRKGNMGECWWMSTTHPSAFPYVSPAEMNTEFLVGVIIDFSDRMAHILGLRTVTRPLFPLFPRTGIIHTCSEGPVTSVTLSLQQAGPNMASGRQGQRCCGSGWIVAAHAACELCPAQGCLPLHPWNPGHALFAESCALFFLFARSPCQLAKPESAERHPPERVPFTNRQKINFVCQVEPARVGALGPWEWQALWPSHHSSHTVILFKNRFLLILEREREK